MSLFFQILDELRGKLKLSILDLLADYLNDDFDGCAENLHGVSGQVIEVLAVDMQVLVPPHAYQVKSVLEGVIQQPRRSEDIDSALLMQLLECTAEEAFLSLRVKNPIIEFEVRRFEEHGSEHLGDKTAECDCAQVVSNQVA